MTQTAATLNEKRSAMRGARPNLLVGGSPTMAELKAEIERVARSDAKVLITGESGSGKELVAQAVHNGSARATAVRGGQLRRPSRNAPRIGAVRARQGQLHRRLPRQARQARACRQRHDVPRRNRRDDAAHAGAAAAVPRNRRAAEGRRRPRRRPGRRPCHRRDQPQPARDDRAGHVPRRPVLPAERHSSHGAAAARAARTTSRRSPSHFLRHFTQQRRHRWRARSAPDAMQALIEYSLARQRARAGKRDRAARRDRRRRGRSRPTICRSKSASDRASGCGRATERRRTVADDLYKRLLEERESFWSRRVSALHAARDHARRTCATWCARGSKRRAATTRSWRGSSTWNQRDYKQFLNFLRKHDCQVPFKEYR